MQPEEFIRKNIVTMLTAEGVPEDVAEGGAAAALAYYHRCSQASRKGRMFDDLLHEARMWVRFNGGKAVRQTPVKPRQGSFL